MRPVRCAATGKASTIKYTVPVAGNPGHPVFYPKNAADNETTFSVQKWPVSTRCLQCVLDGAVKLLHTLAKLRILLLQSGRGVLFLLMQEYLVFFPLTRNTNKANIAAGERQ